MVRRLFAFLMCGELCLTLPAFGQIHDPRDAVIYFAMTDRFADGNVAANASFGDAASWAYDPTRDDRFHGGDVAGVLGRLDYIAGLGATAVWLTPPVLNASWNRDSSFTGYHGYWARDFRTPDPRFGTWAEWRHLADALHDRGMGLIQDVVVNHTGDFFSVEGEGAHDPQELAYPFSLNNPQLAAHRRARIYHWTPEIRDYSNRRQVLTGQLSGLDDLNTAHSEVRRALRSAYGVWMDSLALDGIRFDTQKYVERSFWPDFLWADGSDPGMERKAAVTGRDLFTFGEVWNESGPRDASGERSIRRYLARPGYRGTDAGLNFPLAHTLRGVFARGASVEDLAYRIRAQHAVFPAPERQLVHFLDNHDMPRFRAEGSESAFRQAFRTLLLFPGAVVVYAGTEQGDREVRADMFGRHDTTSADYRWVQAALRTRAETLPWRRAWPEVVVDGADTPGVLVLRSVFEGDTVWSVLNATDLPVAWADVAASGMRPGEVLTVALEGEAPLWQAVEGGFAWLHVPARSWMAFRLGGSSAPATAPSPSLRSAWTVEGVWQSEPPVNLAHGSHRVGRWSIEPSGRPVALDSAWTVRVVQPRVTLVHERDARGDDGGRSGSLQYPTSPGFSGRADLRRLTVVERGDRWQVEVRLHRRHSRVWNPPAGFDHVEVGVWCIVDGGGWTAVPELNAQWPGPGAIGYGFRASGWQLVAMNGNGPAVPPVFLGAQGRTLSWEMPAVPGCRTVWVTTWDADGMGVPRPLEEQPGPYSFGGKDGENARIMDELHGHVRNR